MTPSRVGGPLLLAVVATLVFFVNLGAARLWDRDEPRNARCAQEMLERGDLVVPTFNGELRTHKPVLLYWLMIVAYKTFGVSEFAARFWSAALGVGTTLTTCAIGTRLYDRNVGLWAGLSLTTMFMFNVASHAATPDAPLIFCGTVALAIYVYCLPRRAWSVSDPVSEAHHSSLELFRANWPIGWAIAFYAMLGLGVLTKGPVGFVLPCGIVGLFLLNERARSIGASATADSRFAVRWLRHLGRCLAPRSFLQTTLSMRPLVAFVTIVVIAAPWYWAVGQATGGQWLRGFFWEHNVSRAISSMEGHHGSIFYYPVALLVGTFPWSILTIPVVILTWQQLKQSRSTAATLFLLVWIGTYLGVFSLAQTKLPSYITPCYPAVAILCGRYIAACGQDSRQLFRGWTHVGLGTLAIVGLAILAGLPVAANLFLPGEQHLALIGLVPLLGAAVAWALLRADRIGAMFPTLALTAVLMMIGVFAWIAPAVSQHQQIVSFLRDIRTPLASFGCQEPSWVFYAGRTLRHFEYGQPQSAIAFLTEQPDGCLITTEAHWDTLAKSIPPDFEVRERIPYFLRDESLLVIGRNNSHTEDPYDDQPLSEHVASEPGDAPRR